MLIFVYIVDMSLCRFEAWAFGPIGLMQSEITQKIIDICEVYMMTSSNENIFFDSGLCEGIHWSPVDSPH